MEAMGPTEGEREREREREREVLLTTKKGLKVRKESDEGNHMLNAHSHLESGCI